MRTFTGWFALVTHAFAICVVAFVITHVSTFVPAGPARAAEPTGPTATHCASGAPTTGCSVR